MIWFIRRRAPPHRHPDLLPNRLCRMSTRTGCDQGMKLGTTRPLRCLAEVWSRTVKAAGAPDRPGSVAAKGSE